MRRSSVPLCPISPVEGVGRLVFNGRYGPTALPVVYKIDGGSIVLGTWNPVFDEDLRTGIAHARLSIWMQTAGTCDDRTSAAR